jgi:hypothetical protein
MAAFSILTREGDRAPSSASALRAAAASSVRSPDSLEPEVILKASPRSADPLDHGPGPAPQVALQLPDLAAPEAASTGRGFRFGSLIYWASIVLGGLFALALIWTPKTEALRPMDEAPAWSPPSGSPSDPSASAPRDFGAGQSPEPPRDTTSEQPGEPPRQPMIEPARTLDGPLINNGAAIQRGAGRGWPQPAVDSSRMPSVRTASGPSSRWDGSSNHVRPSEAAPLGITTSVPQ